MMPSARLAILSLGLLLACPRSASASDPARGEAVYRHSCMRCHTAQPSARAEGEGRGPRAQAPRERPRWMGPDLVEVARTKTEPELRAWMIEPRRLAPDSACQSRLDPERAAQVVAYLRLLSRPLPAPKKQRIERSMNGRIERRRAVVPGRESNGPRPMQSVPGGAR